MWHPGDAWPGSAGGAAHPAWSGYVRLYVQAQIASGTPFTIGKAPHDHLDAGNVLGGAHLERATTPATLWVDLTCDLVDLELALGSSSGAGILSKSEAGTLVATFYDPTGKLDPLNPETIYALSGRTRLVPGVPVRAWAEVIVDPTVASPTVATFPLFTGTADRWSSPWKREPTERLAKLTATDPTKTWARADRPALPAPIGAGDTPAQRLRRIADNFAWLGSIATVGATAVTLQASALAQAAWEMAGRVASDELGFAYFAPQPPSVATPGVLTLVAREVWAQRPAPAVGIGCGPGLHDIATDVEPAAFDTQLRNAAYAARTGGTQQVAKVPSSVAKFWEQSIDRSDLGVETDPQAAQWAAAIVTLMAYPQASIDRATLRPAVDPAPWAAWQAVLGVPLITALVRVLWEQGGYTVDTEARLVGWTHKVTPTAWDVQWRTISASVSAARVSFHMGPHHQDVLDAGYVMG
jgi:hypothetical protein